MSEVAINTNQKEEWFLAQLEREALNYEELFATIKGLHGAGETALSDSLAELLQETLTEKACRDQALEVLEWRVRHHHDEEAFRADLEKTLLAILGPAPEQRAIIKNIGLEKRDEPTKLFQRLRLLLHVGAEVLCHDKTWGMGVIKEVDHFYERITIDFEKKSGHEMSFAYAAEALDLINDRHILGLKHKDPDRLRELIERQPDEIVRITIRSYGPLSVPLIQEKLIPAIVDESAWKPFWDRARAALKKDPCLDFPAKRSDPLILRDRAKAFDQSWLDTLSKTRDMKRVLDMIDEHTGHHAEASAEPPAPETADVFANRLAFVIKGAAPKHLDLLARALMKARALKLESLENVLREHAQTYLKEDFFVRTLSSLPAKNITPFIDFVVEVSGDEALSMLLQILPRLDSTSLNEALILLLKHSREEDVAETFRGLMKKKAAGVEVLYWLWRNPDRLEAWSLGPVSLLTELTLNALEEDYTGDRLKVRNQLADKFQQVKSLTFITAALAEPEQRKLLIRLKDSPAWSEMDRRSILAKIIKTSPALELIFNEIQGGSQPVSAATGPVTSHRSYRARQRQLTKIVNEEIPKNSKEIALARSYGDLKENHEYKAAKEMQGILMRRSEELERMLHTVSPTDFDGYPCEEAGPATGVVLEYPDGKTEQYYILGVWDRDEALGIISSETVLAQTLTGCRPGDRVPVTTEAGEVTCTVKEVSGLPESIRSWVEEEGIGM